MTFVQGQVYPVIAGIYVGRSVIFMYQFKADSEEGQSQIKYRTMDSTTKEVIDLRYDELVA